MWRYTWNVATLLSGQWWPRSWIETTYDHDIRFTNENGSWLPGTVLCPASTQTPFSFATWGLPDTRLIPLYPFSWKRARTGATVRHNIIGRTIEWSLKLHINEKRQERQLNWSRWIVSWFHEWNKMSRTFATPSAILSNLAETNAEAEANSLDWTEVWRVSFTFTRTYREGISDSSRSVADYYAQCKRKKII